MPKEIEKFFIDISPDVREVLESFRLQIKKLVPEATESLVYGVPGFRYKEKGLAAYAPAKNHIGYYPMSPKLIVLFKDDLKSFETSKGAIKFTIQKPLPENVIKKIVLARKNEIDGVEN